MKSPRRFVTIALAFVATGNFTRADFAARWEQIKREAAPREFYTILYDLPKGGDLHNHFGGSILPEWMP